MDEVLCLSLSLFRFISVKDVANSSYLLTTNHLRNLKFCLPLRLIDFVHLRSKCIIFQIKTDLKNVFHIKVVV